MMLPGARILAAMSPAEPNVLFSETGDEALWQFLLADGVLTSEDAFRNYFEHMSPRAGAYELEYRAWAVGSAESTAMPTPTGPPLWMRGGLRAAPLVHRSAPKPIVVRATDARRLDLDRLATGAGSFLSAGRSGEAVERGVPLPAHRCLDIRPHVDMDLLAHDMMACRSEFPDLPRMPIAAAPPATAGMVPKRGRWIAAAVLAAVVAMLLGASHLADGGPVKASLDRSRPSSGTGWSWDANLKPVFPQPGRTVSRERVSFVRLVAAGAPLPWPPESRASSVTLAATSRESVVPPLTALPATAKTKPDTVHAQARKIADAGHIPVAASALQAADASQAAKARPAVSADGLVALSAPPTDPAKHSAKRRKVTAGRATRVASARPTITLPDALKPQ